MLDFPKWKITFVLFVCLLGALFALPNFLPEPYKKEMPSWLPSKTINLGLDLQGGSYLLLEVDVPSYIKEQMETLEDDVRQALRTERVGYRALNHTAESVTFTLRNPQTLEIAQELIRDLSRDLLIDITDNQFTILYNDDYIKAAKRNVIEQSIEIVRRRVDETGTREPIIQRQGENRILLQVPGLTNPEHLKRLLGKTAKMTFHLLDNNASVEDAKRGRIPPGSKLVRSEEDPNNSRPVEYIVIKKKIELSGDLLVDSRATISEIEPVVNFRFNNLGARKFADITKQHVGERFAIILDDKVISAPVIREPILGGSGQISGQFTVESANDLALLLRAGALPAPLNIMEERTVGPSLGADSIAAGKMAALIGIVLVIIFMLITYRRFGIYCNIALIMNMILVLAALSLFQATLTLPGIAGIVLTMGMAVDANVLIFERIREETRIGRTPFAAIDHGFRQAFKTIIDSNVTTLITALLLFNFGSGPVKGFGVTLSIGIVASMFSAILLTRMMVVLWLKRARPKTLKI